MSGAAFNVLIRPFVLMDNDMKKEKVDLVSRRDFLSLTGAGLSVGLAGRGPFFIFPQSSKVRQKKLRILQWKHFVPGYDSWFDDVFAKEWGQKHDTDVIIHHVPFWEINAHAIAEVKAGIGHDLVMFPSPPASYESHVIDHAGIYKEIAGRQGQMIKLAHLSTFNPSTKKYFAFTDSYIPIACNYVRDYWEHIGYTYGPTTYDSLREGAKQIRKALGIPCGLGLAPEPDSNVALHSLLWSFGGLVQDAGGNVVINSKETIEALQYVKALYQESGTTEVFNWNPYSNDRAILGGKVSCAVNAVSIARQAEQEMPEMSDRIMMNPSLRGLANWRACPHITSCYVVWRFAENQEGARQFLVDLADNLGTGFKVSGFCNFPCFPKTVPDMKKQLENDPSASPHHKYMATEDALLWTSNIGYPGYATPAVEEVFNTFVIPKMFGAVANGKLSPEDSVAAAEREIRQIFDKWRSARTVNS
jgi:multiple sugar transport system substrate-binding protein